MISAYFDYLLTIKLINKKRYSRYSKLYSFTTENIGGYINNFDLDNKKILTVTSSFDHALNALLLGSNDITNFDINKLCIYMAKLKIAAVIELTKDEFIDFFNIDGDKFLDYKVFERLINSLDIRTVNFFKLIYQKNFIKELFNHEYKIPSSSNLYLEESNFNKLKELISDAKLRFVTVSMTNLNIINGKFDFIFLSNISDYISKIYGENYLDRYVLFIKMKLNSLLNQNGVIACAYIYNFSNNKNPRSDIDNEEIRKKVFDDVNFQTYKFKSVIKNTLSDAIVVYGGNYGK